MKKVFYMLLYVASVALIGCKKDNNEPEPDQKENGHEYVDLGLSVKWATMNVGATTPEGYGDYFAWGETTTKSTYEWSTYKYCGDNLTMTKYCTDSYYGTVDDKTTLDPEDDAARVNWGGNWRMPTYDELDELIDENNCTWTWTTQNNVNGYLVTSKKPGYTDKSIFLPSVGFRNNSDLYQEGSNGYYWSSSLKSSNSAYDLYFGSSLMSWDYYDRYHGQSVRAVCP